MKDDVGIQDVEEADFEYLFQATAGAGGCGDKLCSCNCSMIWPIWSSLGPQRPPVLLQNMSKQVFLFNLCRWQGSNSVVSSCLVLALWAMA